MTNQVLPNNKSASRTLDLIEYIVSCPKPPTFRAIREHLAIPKSSLSYLLQDLVSRNYLHLDPDMKVYYPGLKLIQLGVSCLNTTDISREISLGVKRLSDELEATSHAAILDGRFVVYIAKCQSAKDVSIVTNLGFRIPAHATAVGKVLLANLSQAELALRLQDVQLERYTENTITSQQKLMDELQTIAKQGYAIDDQEIIPGGMCIAAPIFDRSAAVVAAVSATIAKITDASLREVIAKVCVTAEHISMRLGKI